MNNNEKRFAIFSVIAVFTIISIITINMIKPSYAQESSSLVAKITDEESEKSFTNCTNNCNTAKLEITENGSNIYTVKYDFSFAENSTSKKIKATLKEGLKWGEKIIDPYKIVTKIDEEEYGSISTDAGNYIIESGTKTFTIKDGAEVTSGTLSFTFSVDIPLHIENIENAISITRIENEIEEETISINAEIDYSAIEITLDGVSNNLSGSTNSEDDNYFPNKRFVGIFNSGADNINLIYKEVNVEIEVPNDTTIKGYDKGGAGYPANAQVNGWTCTETDNGDKDIYSCTYKNRYGKSVGINPIWDFSKTGAQENDELRINVRSLKYTLYNNSSVTLEPKYYQQYKVINEENVILKPTNNEYEIAVSNFNKEYPNEIIRLGNVYLANTGRDSEEKTITITFPEQIGVTYVSLPVVAGQAITDLQYTLEGSSELIDFNGTLPKETSISGSTSIKFIWVSNELFGTQKYITSIKYKIGSIPFNANNKNVTNDLFYAGIIKKQSDGTYPTSYETTMLVEGQIHKKSYTYKNIVNQNIGFTSCPVTIDSSRGDKKVITKGYLAGETINLEYELKPCSSSGVGHTVTSYEPVVYLMIPEKLELDMSSIKFNSRQYELQPNSTTSYQSKGTEINNYSIEERNKNGYNIYKIEFEKNENTYIGYPKYALYTKAPALIKINFSLIVPKYYNEKMKEYKYNEVVYLTDKNLKDGSNIVMIASKGDPYDVDSDGVTTDDLMTYAATSEEHFFITSPSDINSSLIIVEQLTEDDKTREVETDIKVIKEDSATIKSKIINNSGIDNQKGQIYIPIPRQKDNTNDSIFCNNNECNKYEFDLYLEKLIKETNINKYKIYYGKNIKTIKSYNDINSITKWYTYSELKELTKEELKEINLIKIDVLDIDNNEELDININLYTTEKNTTKDIKYNIINSVYYRNIRNQNDEKLEGWKKTNSITIGLEPTEVEIEVPITSNYISVIITIISIVVVGYGIYLINKRRKKLIVEK